MCPCGCGRIWLVLSGAPYISARLLTEEVLPGVLAAVGCAVGFAVVNCSVSAIRELLTVGTLWGYPLVVPFESLPAAAYVSFGLY